MHKVLTGPQIAVLGAGAYLTDEDRLVEVTQVVGDFVLATDCMTEVPVRLYAVDLPAWRVVERAA